MQLKVYYQAAILYQLTKTITSQKDCPEKRISWAETKLGPSYGGALRST